VKNSEYDIDANKYFFIIISSILLLFPCVHDIFFFAHHNNYRSLFGVHPADRDGRVFCVMQSIVNPFAHCSTLISDLLCQRAANIYATHSAPNLPHSAGHVNVPSCKQMQGDHLPLIVDNGKVTLLQGI